MRGLKPLVWAVGGIAVVVGLYAWAGYWLAPRLIQSKVPALVLEETGQKLTLGPVAVKPFALAVDVQDVALTEPDGAELLSAKRLYMDFKPASIWRRGVVMSELALEEPAVNLVLRPDGTLNLITALTPKTPSPPPDPDARPLYLSIDDISVSRGTISAADLRRPKPLHERLSPLNLRLRNVSTSAEGGGTFNLTGAGQQGEAVTLSGEVALRPFRVAGQFDLKELGLETAWRLAGEYDRIAAPGGELDLRTNYDIASTPEGVQVKLDALDVEARSIAVRAPAAASDWITVRSMSALGGSVDVAASRVVFPDIVVRGLGIEAWTEDHGKINLDALMPAPAAAGAPAPATAAQAADDGWRIEAPKIRVVDAKASFEDRGPAEPVKVVLAPLEIDIDRYATGAPSIGVAVRSMVNEAGKLDVKGDWEPPASRGEFTVSAESLPLVFLQPYLDATSDVVLKSGELTVQGKTRVALPPEGDADVAFDGGATFSKLRTIDRTLREDFVKFGSLALNGLSWTSNPANLRIRDVVARGSYFKLIIAPDSTTNISTVLSPPRLARAEAPPPPVAKAAAKRPSKRSARKAEAKPAPAPIVKAEPLLPFKARIDKVRLIDSSANFADQTLRPPFATGIVGLEGTITGLSSEPDSRAEVELDGKVDRYAPVEIRGQVNYLSATSFTDVSAKFENIELPAFTPYSGKFMGYKIEKGKLTANLNYKVVDRQLDARHHFTLDQLTLGEKVESPDATKLPVKLAIALLKDRNGVIDLDLPISGSIDDPQFRVGPIIWKMFVNLLVKIVTSPFALIGSLFGAGEEVRYVDFPFGSAELDAGASERLTGVGKALNDRPALNLEVPLVYDAKNDTEALVSARLQDSLLAAAGPKRAADAAALAELRSSDIDEFQEVLDAAWLEATGEKRAPRPERLKDEDKDAWKQRSVEGAEQALRERLAIGNDELAALAKRRADAVRDALIGGGGLAPERVFITAEGAKADQETPDSAAPANAVRLALRVE